jgi:hypothetical protein
MHAPSDAKETVPDAIVHTPDEAASMLNSDAVSRRLAPETDCVTRATGT